MAEDHLTNIYRACEPSEPATAEYYLDCAEARGGGHLTAQFCRHLQMAAGPRCFLFSGHIGSGKSSELSELRRVLLKNEIAGRRFFPVLVNCRDYLDEADVTPTDIILTAVTDLAATFRDELKIELKDNYFVDRFREIINFFGSEVEMKDFTISLWGMKPKLQLLRSNGWARERVRDALKSKITTIAEETNTVFAQARIALGKHKPDDGGKPFDDFVLILDGLEKIQALEREKTLALQRDVFLEGAPTLTRMRAHVMYTVPLELVRAEGPKLMQRYDAKVFVLPMVKIAERVSRQPYRPGVACIRDLLQKRLGGMKLEEAFEPDALDFLITYSGGHIRNLLFFIREACAEAVAAPISLKSAHKGIRDMVRVYSSSTPEAHWAKLAALDCSKNQKIPSDDDDCTEMLANLSVMEYLNGGDEDPFAEEEPWYAVNPIVRELQKFKEARSGLSQVRA
jgi:hypothetical protein